MLPAAVILSSDFDKSLRILSAGNMSDVMTHLICRASSVETDMPPGDPKALVTSQFPLKVSLQIKRESKRKQCFLRGSSF